jgi:D-alanine-D-alanine ligase
MSLRIGFAYNEKPADDGEPPSSSPAGTHDLYAEWDAPETIDAVAAALARAGSVIRLEADASFPVRLQQTRPDIVFNIAEGLHGPNREAHVPAICEFLDVPHTGSDPLALCLGLDKRRSKEAFLARGVPTPAFRVASRLNGAVEPLRGLRLPVMVKPLFEGSSKGIPESALCRSADAVRRRVAEIGAAYDQPALVEEFLPGREFTCAVLGNGDAARVLPPVEVRFDALPAGAAPIYGYEAKWLWDTSEAPLQIFDCPAAVDPALGQALASTALAAFHALGCRDWARVDLRLDADGEPQVIEINPLPGILPRPEQNSCFPKAARAAGLSYDELILAVLDHALDRYGLHR